MVVRAVVEKVGEGRVVVRVGMARAVVVRQAAGTAGAGLVAARYRAAERAGAGESGQGGRDAHASWQGGGEGGRAEGGGGEGGGDGGEGDREGMVAADWLVVATGLAAQELPSRTLNARLAAGGQAQRRLLLVQAAGNMQSQGWLGSGLWRER